MATSYIFGNKKIKIPGAYSQIKSGISNPAVATTYGNTLVIDTGSGKFYGGGSGVAGTLKSGKDALYAFDAIQDVKSFMHGGPWWMLPGFMFFPGGGAASGISSFSFIRACATVPAEIPLSFTGGGGNGGSVTLQMRNEGRIGNGVLGDETRATSTLTISSAGTVGSSSVAVSVSGETVASYATVAGDNIAAVITGLVTSMKALGICDVVSSTSTTIVFRAPRGKGASANTITPAVAVTGTAAGSAVQFSGGVNGTKLTRGYAAKVVTGSIDPTKIQVQLWVGTFKGLDDSIGGPGLPLDGINELESEAALAWQSDEFSNISDFITWMQNDYQFSQYAALKAGYTVTGTGAVAATDAVVGYVLASGGTETYNSTHLNAALDAVKGQSYDFILADNWGDNARSANNLTILAFIATEAKVQPDLYVGGGRDVSKWNAGVTSSVNMAQAYNSQFVSLVHGGPRMSDYSGRKLNDFDSIVKAAFIIGREAGLEPQNPLSYKGIGISGEIHALKDKEVELGLDAGVLMTRLDNTSYDVIKGINTLQNNDFIVNPDGSTHVKQLARIIRQINKELVINARATLLKKPNGANRNTLAPEDVKAWVEGFLTKKIATNQQDNLILEYRNVNVVREQDAYKVYYEAVANTEIAFLFFVGFLVD